MKKLFVFSLFVGLFAGVAGAGPSTSGGGFAVVCRDTNNNIQSAELLDIYEGRTTQGLQIMEPSGSFERDYVRAVKNVYRLQGYNPPIPESEMLANVSKFMRIVEFLPADEKLPNLGDLGKKVPVPEGCAIEPLAILYDSQKIATIDRKIWDALNSLSKAALVIHEIYYQYARQIKVDPDTNSLESRIITAMHFSLDLISVKSGVPTDAEPIIYYHNCLKQGENLSGCTEPSVYYKLANRTDENGKPILRIQFTHLAGRPLLALSTLDIPTEGLNVGDILQFQSKQLQGWTAEIARQHTPSGGYAMKLLIRRGSVMMYELPL